MAIIEKDDKEGMIRNIYFDDKAERLINRKHTYLAPYILVTLVLTAVAWFLLY
jgi:hypothetical protein